MRIMFLDIETNGLPERIGFDKYHHPSLFEKYNGCRVIEIAYIIYSDKIIEKEYSSLVIPDGFKIENSQFHGITEDKANENGNNINIILEEMMKDLENVDCIISHNINFDINIVLSEAYRYGHTNIASKIENIKKLCTMFLGKLKMKQRKNPKLVELYKFLFGKEVIQEHRALSDTKICAECYFKMK